MIPSDLKTLPVEEFFAMQLAGRNIDFCYETGVVRAVIESIRPNGSGAYIDITKAHRAATSTHFWDNFPRLPESIVWKPVNDTLVASFRDGETPDIDPEGTIYLSRPNGRILIHPEGHTFLDKPPGH